MHLLGALAHGGLETWLMEMVRKIDRRKIAIDVCVTMQKKGAYEEEFQQLGGRIYRCPLRKNLFAFAKNLRQILRQGEYDILESHHYLATGYFLRVASKIPHLKLVAHMHPTIDFQTGQRMAFPRPIYRKIMKKWIYKYADTILGASKATLELNWGCNWEKDPKIHFLPNGIDISEFDINIDPQDIRQKLSLPPESKIILTVGRHVPHKKHIIIPEIAKEICKQRDDVYFVINGKGPLKDELENKIKQMGLEKRFRLISGLPSLVPLWKSSDVFLFPSSQEGFGIVVIEAAAAGLPVIARDIPGVGEAITACNNYILLEKQASIKEWIQAVSSMLDIGRINIENYDELEKSFKFTTKKSVEKLLSVYEEIVK